MEHKHLTFNVKPIGILMLLLFSFTAFGQQANEMPVEISQVKTHMDKDLQWGPCPPFMPEGCGITVLHGDPAKNNVDILFKVEANTDIPEHWHKSAERMILLTGQMEVTYEGEAKQVLEVGSYAYGPASKPHIAKCLDAGPCTLFIAFEEPLDAFAMEK